MFLINPKMQNKISKIYLISLIVYLPFQSLFVSLLIYNTSLTTPIIFWLTHCYELLIIPVILLLLFTKQLTPNLKKNYPIILLIFLSIVSIVFFSITIGRGLEGFRFSILPLIFYLIAHTATKKDQFNSLLKPYLYLAAISASFAIFDQFMPPFYWQIIGMKTFGWGNFNVVNTLQGSGIFQGPNQLASYLLPAFFISLCLNHKKNFTNYFILTLLLSAIILTFSRSALIGLSAGIIIYIIIYFKNRALKYILLLLFFLCVALLPYAYQKSDNQNFKNLISHDLSNTGHQNALNISLIEVERRLHKPVVLLFGSGIGSSGPSTLKYGNGIISESWYFQIFFELGLIGLILWLLFISGEIKKHYKSYPGLFLALISVSICAIFLHTFADNPALSITLMILLGTRSVNINKVSATK
jgi:hypothetical protein